MGWADMLVKLHVPYNSKEALSLAEKLMKFVQMIGWETSSALGKEKGNFPNFKGSLWQKRGYKHFRNATVTTIAPTGTISMMANASGGIEPHFALAYFRKSMGQYTLPEVNADLVKAIKHVNGLYSNELMDEIARSGSIQHIERIPKEIRETYVTAMDLKAEDHVAMLAAFQKYTDNAVSKTINLPGSATVEDLNSTNGTRVNGRRVESHTLRHGDQIGVGRERLMYFAELDEASRFAQPESIEPFAQPAPGGETVNTDTAIAAVGSGNVEPPVPSPALLNCVSGSKRYM